MNCNFFHGWLASLACSSISRGNSYRRECKPLWSHLSRCSRLLRILSVRNGRSIVTPVTLPHCLAAFQFANERDISESQNRIKLGFGLKQSGRFYRPTLNPLAAIAFIPLLIAYYALWRAERYLHRMIRRSIAAVRGIPSRIRNLGSSVKTRLFICSTTLWTDDG